MKNLLVALALLAAMPAAAQAPLPALNGRVLLGGCRQGECGWFRVTRIERVRTVPQGELRRITGRRGNSVHGVMNDPPAGYSRRVPIVWEAADRAEYVFCSRARPAYAFPEDGVYIVHYLDLFDLAGYQQSSAAMYMRACHGVALPASARLRRLGYRPGTRNEQVEDARPDDLATF